MRIIPYLALTMICCAIPGIGCVYQVPDTDAPRVLDSFFHERHPSPEVNYRDPMMELARGLTKSEDDLRRDGTITVKSPDVWGDGDLMYFLQQFDAELTKAVSGFAPSVQAYVVHSDAMELQQSSSLSAALGKSGSQSSSSTTSSNTASTTSNGITLPDPFTTLSKLNSALGASQQPSAISLEPTELVRQHATYVDVCQQLLRRHIGDDNSRSAGYGLYKFRIPVSILPGRETHQGYSAVVTMRAQVKVNEAQLQYMFPKLVIADLADTLTPLLLNRWDAVKLDSSDKTKACACLHGIIDHLGQKAHNRSCPIETRRRLTKYVARLASYEQRLEYDGVSLTGLASAIEATMSDICADENADSTDSHFKTKFEDVIGKPVPQADVHPDAYRGFEEQPVALPAGKLSLVYRDEAVLSLVRLAKQDQKVRTGLTTKPQAQEVREFLFGYLPQVHNAMQKNHFYSNGGLLILDAGRDVAAARYGCVKNDYTEWMKDVGQSDIDLDFQQASWAIAVQTGILEVNMRKILEELSIKGKLSGEQQNWLEDPDFHFFDVAHSPFREPAVSLWQTIVREDFPLHVFTLDSQVEEQNVYSGLSRSRDLELALAYKVAKGGIGAQHSLNMARKLQLDEVAIGLNRTVVGFSHGEDTFGWYFYPRVQPPPPEASNIAAFARILWSTGPTAHYDTKHQQLEPGIRECEALVAMPSFVSEVTFEVTTNWERLTSPGSTKRSYESMLGQGSQIQHLRRLVDCARENACYRPGDLERLASRVEQLDAMLGMQTYLVNVPYSYDQSGSDLFDTGNAHLRPVLTGFYGLQFLDASTSTTTPTTTTASGSSSSASGSGGSGTQGSLAGAVTVNVGTTPPAATTPPATSTPQPDTSAHVFLAGKNFHPTLTYVVVGGTESTETNFNPAAGVAPTADVTVINRELLEVKINKLNPNLSSGQAIEVRVGTPAGLSNPLTIRPAKSPSAQAFYFGSDQTKALKLQANIADGGTSLKFNAMSPVVITGTVDQPLQTSTTATVMLRLTAAKQDGTAIMFCVNKQQAASFDVVVNPNQPAVMPPVPMPYEVQSPLSGKAQLTIPVGDLQSAINLAIAAPLVGVDSQPFVITATGYIYFNKWPAEKTTNTITISVPPDSKSGGPSGSSMLKPAPLSSAASAADDEPVAPLPPPPRVGNRSVQITPNQWTRRPNAVPASLSSDGLQSALPALNAAGTGTDIDDDLRAVNSIPADSK